MLLIYDDPESKEDTELKKLVGELKSLLSTTPKRQAKDDFVDSLRYCVAAIPWNWEGIELAKPVNADKRSDAERAREEEIAERRGLKGLTKADNLISVDDELAGWNDLMENF